MLIQRMVRFRVRFMVRVSVRVRVRARARARVRFLYDANCGDQTRPAKIKTKTSQDLTRQKTKDK